MKKNDFNIVEFEDILEKIINTSLEKEIIEYRRLGWTDAVISEKLGISQSHVTGIRHTLFKRYQKI